MCFSFSYQTIVFLQYLASKKIFSRGYDHDGLYYFSDPLPPSVSSSNLQVSVLPLSTSSVFSLATLELWYVRLRHANFQYLCWLFLSLNKACKNFTFKCVVCELSTHTRTSYIPRMHLVILISFTLMCGGLHLSQPFPNIVIMLRSLMITLVALGYI